MDRLLADRTAIITGGSSGLGRAIARRFAEQGADVVVADVRETPREGGRPTADLIEDEFDVGAVRVDCDVTERADLLAAVEHAREFGGVDAMVNNAGLLGPTETLLETDPEEYRRTVAVNLDGTYLGSQVAGLDMLERDADGCILNLSSIAGFRGYSNRTTYCATKGGIRLLTYALAEELGPHGIRVNAIHPGATETAMTRSDGEVIDSEESDERLEAIPLRRFGEPRDVANVALFLASDLASYVTAASVVVDGGVANTS